MQAVTGRARCCLRVLCNNNTALAHTLCRRSSSLTAADNVERTLVAMKPDGVSRRLVGQVLSGFEQRGYKLCAIKMCAITDAQVKLQYPDIVEKPFFASFSRYMRDGVVVVMVWQGRDVVNQARRMLGKTNPLKADQGSIRATYSQFSGRNIVHSADSVASAEREIAIWFEPNEIIDWRDPLQSLFYEADDA